jgi:uncharacterized membrane protein YfcA
MTLWLWLAAPFIGILLGLFGAGGGMLTVPLLMYGAGLPLKQAIATSVWIVAGVSLIAAFHQRAWRVAHPALLIFFSIGGIAGSIAGTWLGIQIAPAAQQALFGILLLFVSEWTWRVRPQTSPPSTHTCRCISALLVGGGLGVLTGLLGVGGGFLMVPALIALGLSHFPTAIAHSLLLIAVNATTSGMANVGRVSLAPQTLATVGTLAAMGSIIGSRILRFIPLVPLQRGFSLGLAALGTAMLIQLIIA